jgi:hypothetical protein
MKKWMILAFALIASSLAFILAGTEDSGTLSASSSASLNKDLQGDLSPALSNHLSVAISKSRHSKDRDK